MTLFENAGIIGLGLIGGSLARAMKKNSLAKNIIGYTKSPESCSYALESGIIDSIANPAYNLATNCDIIIICTPLSSYDAIFKEISPALLNKNCIITDVGSIKSPIIKIAEKYLSTENIKNFIPAHPIAGTEKTGVESGFAELFKNKKTILTPLKNTNQNAIELVSKLWQGCGSHTQIIDANEHDRIYAEVSHLPQFLAYCYASLLLDEGDVLRKSDELKNNQDFWKFSRICASNPAIWFDIFHMNIDNLSSSLNNFIYSIENIAEISKSKKLTNSNNVLDNNEKTIANTFPATISQALIQCSPNASEYAGSGFNDFTSYINKYTEYSEKQKNYTASLISKSEMLLKLIQKNDYKNALAFMQESVNFYDGLKNTVMGDI